jgi:hypothetical protein
MVNQLSTTKQNHEILQYGLTNKIHCDLIDTSYDCVI